MRFFLKVCLMLYVQSVMCSVPTPESIHQFVMGPRIFKAYAQILQVPYAMIVAANCMLDGRCCEEASEGIVQDQADPSNISSPYGKALKAEIAKINKQDGIPEFQLSLNAEQKKECDALIVDMIKQQGVGSVWNKHTMRQMIYVIYQHYTVHFDRLRPLMTHPISTISPLIVPNKFQIIREITLQNMGIIARQALSYLEHDWDMGDAEFQIRYWTLIDTIHYMLETEQLDYLLSPDVDFRNRRASEFINFLGSLYRQQVAKRLYESQQLCREVVVNIERLCQGEFNSRLAIETKYQQVFDETKMCFERSMVQTFQDIS